MEKEYLIWWLAQVDYERIEDTRLEELLPKYIYREFRSRCGRSGRGRLWISKDIPIKEIDWDNSKPLAQAAGNAGGIVIKKKDARYIVGLPGFITDTRLDLFVPSLLQ